MRPLQILLLGLSLALRPLAAAGPAPYARSLETYPVPEVVLVGPDGKRTTLRRVLETGEPVVLDFIFGTCTTICPVLSAGYANLQVRLGPASSRIRLVSISIDPENDTPKVLREYLQRYRARPGWDFYTGTREDIDKVMRAFNAYIPNKMSHQPLTFLRRPGAAQWVRIQGLMSSSEFLDECRLAGLL